jgi:hypothetical protein
LINSSKIFYFRKLDSSLGRILSSDVCTHGDEVIFMFNLRDVLLDTVYTVTRTSVYQVSSQTIFKSLAANSFLACGKTSAHGDPNPDSSSLIGDKWLPLKVMTLFTWTSPVTDSSPTRMVNPSRTGPNYGRRSTVMFHQHFIAKSPRPSRTLSCTKSQRMSRPNKIVMVKQIVLFGGKI